MSPWVDYYNTGIGGGAGGQFGMQFGLEEVQLAGNLANMVKIQEYDPSFYDFVEQQQQQENQNSGAGAGGNGQVGLYLL